MTGSIPRIRRKNAFNLYREAGKLKSFDEYPLLRPEVDPQLHFSNNEVDQPFWLALAKDCVLTQSSGRSRVLFRAGPARYFDMEPGEFVYVPAQAAHRVIVEEPGILLRYKAKDFGAETVLWFCESCNGELFRLSWKESEMLPQAGYLQGIQQFNAQESRRTCKSCGAQHPAVDLAPFRWEAVANALARGEDDEED
jgi:hypothetical protein